MKPAATLWEILKVVIAAILGGLAGQFVWPQVESNWGASPRAGIGALIFAIGYVVWRPVAGMLSRIREAEWSIEEIELKLGESVKIKVATNEVERRIAWSLFVELSTRIATQAMDDTEGDDGVALASLYGLFQSTRQRLAEIQPNRTPPKSMRGAETVESYALRLLNTEMRPFLSKWHPRWDAWRKKFSDAPQSEWPDHGAFRAGLRVLQASMKNGTIGLGRIAGLGDPARYLSGAADAANAGGE